MSLVSVQQCTWTEISVCIFLGFFHHTGKDAWYPPDGLFVFKKEKEENKRERKKKKDMKD